MVKKQKSLLDEPNQMAIDLIGIVTRLAKESVGECDCTVHRRTGDIIEVCGPCGAAADLSEIYTYAGGFQKNQYG